MGAEFILRFEVVRVGGRGASNRIIRVFSDKEQAISWAKENYENANDIAVIQRRYASQENLKRGFAFDYNYIWASYM